VARGVLGTKEREVDERENCARKNNKVIATEMATETKKLFWKKSMGADLERRYEATAQKYPDI
jgi:hypothetical protein